MNKKNRKGFGFMTSMLVAIMSLFLFLALTPVIVQMFGANKGSDSANCPGYVDPNYQALGQYNKSYNPNLGSNSLTCTVLDFGPGLIVLGVVFAVIIGIITGKLGSEQPQQQYNPYGYG